MNDEFEMADNIDQEVDAEIANGEKQDDFSDDNTSDTNENVVDDVDESESPASADNGATVDEISQTKAFSKRLNEKTEEIQRQLSEEAQKKVDEVFRRAYDGQIDPITGDTLSIDSEADYIAWEEKARIKNIAEQNQLPEKEAKELNEDQKFIRQQRIAEEKRKAEVVKEAENQKYIMDDIADFSGKFPDVEVSKLMKNESFLDYADGKIMNKPLATVYDGFLKLVGNAEAAATVKVNSKAQRSTNPGKLSGKDMLTPEQKADLGDWNRRNPDMKMTEKEFLKGF